VKRAALERSLWKASDLEVHRISSKGGCRVSVRDGWFLKAHGVFLDLTLDDVRKDSETALAFSQ